MSASGAVPGSKKYFEETWFEMIFLAGCFLVAGLLFTELAPPVNMSEQTIQDVAMATLFAEGRILDAFTNFSQSPGYPLLLTVLMKTLDTTDLYRLTDGALNMNIFLYMASIGLVYYFIRRQIRKPYIFIITGLYVLAPATLGMAWTIGPEMAYLTFSLAALVAIDRVMSKETAESGYISQGELFICGSLSGFAILLKPVGYLVLVAFFFIMLKRCGLKKSATTLGILLLCLSPFVGRDVYSVFKKPDPYVAPSANLVQSAQQKGITRTVRVYMDDALRNITQQTVGELHLKALDQHPAGADDHIGIGQLPWGRWILGTLAIVGVLYGLYLYTGVGSLYLTAYLLTALVFLPDAEIGLALVSPLLLFYLYFGVMRFGEWMKKLHLPVSKVVGPALTVWILLCTMTHHLQQPEPASASLDSSDSSTSKASISSKSGEITTQGTSKVVYMSTIKKPETKFQEAQIGSARRRALQWLKQNTPETARVAIPRPEAAAMMAKESFAKASDSTKTGLNKALAHYDYLVEESAGALSPIQANADPSRGLKMVYEDLPGKIRIWQVQSGLR